jgi:hypothetical protein
MGLRLSMLEEGTVENSARITLANDKFDAQIFNVFIAILYMYRVAEKSPYTQTIRTSDSI